MNQEPAANSPEQPDVSVLIPISDRHDDIGSIFNAHQEILAKLGLNYEFIFVLDGQFSEAENDLKNLQKAHRESVKVIRFNRIRGEAAALTAAFSRSSGNLLLTLPAYFQVQPSEIEKLFAAMTDDRDAIIASRFPRGDNWVNRMQGRLFHKIISWLVKESFHDIACGVRLLRRAVMKRISLYGDLHRFIPLLAIQKGFRVVEIPLAQASEDYHLRVYRLGVYWRRLLDILTVFFLIKFTHKPLRFFGLIGSVLGASGLLITAITVYQRVFQRMGLAERPLFLIGVLLCLVGLQTFFIGLVGEIIIFTHMPSEPGYNIEDIIE